MRRAIRIVMLGLALAVCARGAEHAHAEREDDDDEMLVALADDLPDLEDRPVGQVVGPPIGEVLAAAYAAAGLDRDPTRGLARRARLAGLVPYLSVRTARDVSWRDGEPDVGRGATLEVRATWRLDRLVFDARELGASSLAAALRRERRRLATIVIRTYFVWQRAASSTRSARRAEEAAAALDAVTDGWFSEAVERAQRVRRPVRGQ